jgi:hypothetical protein
LDARPSLFWIKGWRQKGEQIFQTVFDLLVRLSSDKHNQPYLMARPQYFRDEIPADMTRRSGEEDHFPAPVLFSYFFHGLDLQTQFKL